MGLRTIIYLNNKHISYMESNELLASLAKMEANLNEVESARKQVESAVNASTELQKVVSEYVSSVKALCVNLQSWESELRAREGAISNEYEDAISRVNSTCTEIISSFGTVVEKASTDFKGKTDSTIEKFTQQNTILTERVKDMNALKNEINKAKSEIQAVKESLSQISKDLKESQDSQDAVLEDIKQNVFGLKETVTTAASNISQDISNAKQDLSDTQNQANNKIDSVADKADTLATNIANLTTLCQNIANSISSSIKDLNTSFEKIKDDITNAISETKKEIKKTGIVNRWIIIVGFIIISILQLILFL